MKKCTAFWVGLISVFVFLLAGCSNGDTFTAKSYVSGESEITAISVQVTDRELEIGASEDGQIHVDYFDGEKEFLEISVSESKELTVRLTFDKDWTDFIGTKPSAEYRKISLKIPAGMISVLSVSTTNEAVKVQPLSVAEYISLSTNGGDIVFEKLGAGKSIELTAKNGDITGSIIGGWDDFAIACSIKKGECNSPSSKEEGEKSLSVNCNNGDVDIKFVNERLK